MRTLGGYFFPGAVIMRFTKPALSLEAQLDLLVERGLTIPDRSRALHFLRHINYYRLGAYWLPFEADHDSHCFQCGARFEDVLNLYVFDREFRLLVLDAIERLEVSVRAQWAYYMAHTHGAHCHLAPALFARRDKYQAQREKLEGEVRRSQETFIRHLRETYDEPLPPVWALVEVMTFGQLSQWYGNTRYRQDRNAVAKQYGLDEKVLGSLLHHLSTVRNLCAHHARLWNREFTFMSRLPRKGSAALLDSLRDDRDRRIYNTLTFILYLMNQVSPGHTWAVRLLKLAEKHEIPVREMGFPQDWRDRPLWQAV